MLFGHPFFEMIVYVTLAVISLHGLCRWLSLRSLRRDYPALMAKARRHNS